MQSKITRNTSETREGCKRRFQGCMYIWKKKKKPKKKTRSHALPIESYNKMVRKYVLQFLQCTKKKKKLCTKPLILIQVSQFSKESRRFKRTEETYERERQKK